MKAWLFLLVAHVAICAVAAYLFQHRETTHVDHSPVVETTTETQAPAGERSLWMPTTNQTITYHQTITFPGPLIFYAVIGLLALMIGGAFDLYSFLRSPPPALNPSTKG